MKRLNNLLLIYILVICFSFVFDHNTLVYATDNDIDEINSVEYDLSNEHSDISQTISFVDGTGKPLEIKDTVSLGKLENQGGVMVTVPVYGKDTNVTEDYDNDEPLYNLSLVNSSITFTGLNKDTTYYIGFDLNEDLVDYNSSKSYVFKKLNTETNEYDYYAFASFTPENDENKIIIDSNYLEPISNFSSEQLEEIFSAGEIMELAPVTQCFTINACYNKSGNYSYSFDFERWNESSSSTTDTWISYKESGTNSFRSSKQICGTHSSGYSTSGTLNGRSVTVSNHGSVNPTTDTCVTTKECDPVGSSETCTYALSATQTYK